MKLLSKNTIIRIILCLGIIAAVAGGYMAYAVNNL